ncbi:MAG: prepilin-type N-terminal cleavage/methylation domain-containing protein [Gemmatimonadota bacterium]|nr:prepilin-type N-terminal cleavage/methylation domain-containing protein [Gemmatimonadota bacterium]
MKNTRAGFTIVEVLVAVMVLTIGLLGLVTTAGLVTRMIGQGQRYTEASALANERFEVLRAQGCPAAATGAETRGAYNISWRVAGLAGGKGRALEVIVRSPTTRGTRTDSFSTVHFCP